MTTAELRKLLSSAGFGATDEHDIQDAIALLLMRKKIRFKREVVVWKPLPPGRGGDRIDFLVEDGIGIEVKVAGGYNEVMRQLARYAESDQVQAIVLATTRLQLTRMPDTLNGKPVVTAPLFGAIL